MLSVDDRGPRPRCPAPFNLAAYVLEAGHRTPEKPALSIVGSASAETWSYARLTRAVGNLTGALRAEGHPPGARVVLRLGNNVDFPLAFLAAAAAGLVPVVVSAQLTEYEVQGVITATTPAFLIADPDLPLPETSLPCHSIAMLDRRGAGAPVDPVPGDPDRPGYIVFTSGTEGQPRAVVHAHRAVYARRMMWQGWYGLDSTDRLLHAGAFNWTYTLGTGLLDPWAAGATALIPAVGVAADALPKVLCDHNATIFAAAPGLYRRLLRASEFPKVPTLRHGLSAGEKLPDALRADWERATGRPVYEAFGMSECSTFISGCPDRPAPPATLGYAQTGRRIAILGPDRTPVPRGRIGRLAVAGDDPGLMLGYLGASPPDRGSWFVTGDHAEMQADGAVIYRGRADDVMNAGGVRVSPLEVEAVLAQHTSIDDCAVAEVTIKADTSVIAAFYVSADPLDDAALNAHMSERLARYKCPRIYVRVDVLPRNPNGKLTRRALRALYEARDDQA